MRRSVRPIPFAGSAIWTRRLGVCGALLAAGAVLLPRRHVDASTAVAILAAGLGCAMLALVAALVAAAVVWRTGFKGIGRTMAGLILSLVTLAYPGYVVFKTVRQLPAADLSTNKDDPPQFAPADKDALAAATTPAIDPTWLLGHGQQAGEVEPVRFDHDPGAAYRAALKTVTQLHWRVVSATAPTARTPSGRIDALTYSAVMRLPEWLAIRIDLRNGQTRVDVRSVARTVLPLAGDDALRNIQAFADAMEDQDAEN